MSRVVERRLTDTGYRRLAYIRIPVYKREGYYTIQLTFRPHVSGNIRVVKSTGCSPRVGLSFNQIYIPGNNATGVPRRFRRSCIWWTNLAHRVPRAIVIGHLVTLMSINGLVYFCMVSGVLFIVHPSVPVAVGAAPPGRPLLFALSECGRRAEAGGGGGGVPGNVAERAGRRLVYLGF